MRQMFPEGSGGPFVVPGVGVVIGGEPFDYPELISACVPVEGGESATEGVLDDDGTHDGEHVPPDGPQAAVDAAENPSAPPAETNAKPRARGSKP